jgi:hypothetical protein
MTIIKSPIHQYQKYYQNGDRREIFKLLVDYYDIQSALYPGSYIHIAPSFYIPKTVYVDSYKKIKNFFNNGIIFEFIEKNRVYKKKPTVRFHNSNYNLDFGEKLEDFDLLISLHAGFVSQSCKKYLKEEGILLANNSHGDASMAHLDTDYKFIAKIYRANRQYWLTDKNLENYFVPKKRNLKITKKYLKEIQRGVGYTKTASAYVFRKMK